MENRVKRLERTVVVLSIFVSILAGGVIGTSIFVVRKTNEITEKITDYKNVEKYVEAFKSIKY